MGSCRFLSARGVSDVGARFSLAIDARRAFGSCRTARD